MNINDQAQVLLATAADQQIDRLAAMQADLRDRSVADRFAETLKDEVEKTLRNDSRACWHAVTTLQRFAAYTGKPRHAALVALAHGNYLFIIVGDYAAAINQFDLALAQYKVADDLQQQARVLISKIGALVNLGRFDEAASDGEWARQILTDIGDYDRLGRLTHNLAVGLYQRRGDDRIALTLLDEASAILREHVDPEHTSLPLIEQCRVAPLRHLGRYDDALIAAERAEDELNRLGYAAEAARARQNRALTYYALGRYNEALHILEEVKAYWMQEQRERDAIAVELFISDVLLSLHRYEQVIATGERVRLGFSERGVRFEVAQAIVNQARAHVGLNAFDAALAALLSAESLLANEQNILAVNLIQLERATVLLAQDSLDEAVNSVEKCIAVFQAGGWLVPECNARLVAAEALMRQSNSTAAQEHLSATLAIGEELNVPTVILRCHALRGDWFQAAGQLVDALGAYDSALQSAEILKSHIMIEYRVTFSDSLSALYEKATSVSIALERFDLALQYAERAKSRALLDLIAQRLDVSIEARTASDEPLVEELRQLRRERDRLYRQLGSNEQLRLSDRNRFGTQIVALQRRIVDYEERITQLWHQLLIRNADYARDVALWQVHVEPAQMYLDANTALLEYFIVDAHYILFLVTYDEVVVVRLDTNPKQIARWLDLFRMNCRRVVPNRNRQVLIDALHLQANELLQLLYGALLEPVIDQLSDIERLIIVPHGTLHHLPFHALFDQEQYLLERFELSLLPASSLLRFIESDVPAKQDNQRFFAFGYSADNSLPHTVQEAADVAQIMGGTAYVDDAATLTRVRELASQADILHLATHGEFNADNPLFSGLTLADGQLVTLDVFTLSLRASLVTLSACETGQSLVSRGDELLGLARGFLSAGARSLILTHWSVEDQSTALFMTRFYLLLQQGATKSAALRRAQQSFIHAPPTSATAHPYFWATFTLVGASGQL